MKFELRENEIEMEPESEFDRDVLEKLHKAGKVKITDGESEDRSWPPNPRKTNVILKLPKSDDWGN